jgi:O-antigen/teichoic acid export membrane protein
MKGLFNVKNQNISKNKIPFIQEKPVHIPTRIIRGSGAVLTGKIGLLIIGFLFTPILVRLIGREGFGIYGTLISVYIIVRTISILGLEDSTRKHIAQYSHIKGSRDEIASFSIFVAAGMGLGCAFVGILLIRFLNISGKLEPRLSSYLMIVLGVIIISNILEAIVSSLYGIYKEKNVAIIRVLQKALFFSFAILLLKMKPDLTGVFWGLMFGELFAAIYAFSTLSKAVKISLYAALSGARNYGRQILCFGIMTVVGILSAELLYQSDILIVRFFKGDSITGVYKAARVAGNIIIFLPPALQLVMLTNCSELWQQKRRKELLNIATKLWKYNFLFLSLVCIGLAVLAEPFVNAYFGSEFEDTVLPLIILIPGFFFFGLARIMNPVIVGSGWVKQTTILDIFTAIFNIALNLLLVPKLGAVGAAIGTSIAFVTLFLGYLMLIQLRGLNFVKEFPFIRSIALLVIFGGIFYFLCTLWPFGEISKLLVMSPLGAGIFILLTLALNIVSIEELQMRVWQAMRIFTKERNAE